MGAKHSPIKALRYQGANVPRQIGEVARLRVLKGPDQGLTIVLTQSTAILGRGDDVDVGMSDPKVSRKHVQMQYTTQGWKVTDLGSSNGILYQGHYVREAMIQSGEHFTLGETLLEFYQGSEQTRVLVSPFRNGEDLAQKDQQLILQQERVQQFSQQAQINDLTPAKKKNPAQALLLLLALAAGYFYLFDEQPVRVKKAPKPKEETALAMPPHDASLEPVNGAVEKTSDSYYRSGFREFNQSNFLRAKAQFELALQVNPQHALAKKYLKLSENEIKLQITEVIQTARKEENAGRYRAAKGLYETAQRLLYMDRTAPEFLECEESIRRINEKGGL